MTDITPLDWIGGALVLIVGAIIFRQYFLYGLIALVAALMVLAWIGTENIIPALIVLVVVVVLGGSLVMAFQRGQASVARNAAEESQPRSRDEIARIRQANEARNAARNQQALKSHVTRPEPTGKYR